MTRSVRRTCERRLRELDLPADAVTVEDIVQVIGVRRGRAVHLEAMNMSASGLTGAWLPAASADYIFYESDTSARHQAQIVAHELGHMIAGHRPALHLAGGGLGTTLAAATAHMMARNAYDDRQEEEAEHLADLLLSWLDTSAGRRADALTQLLQRHEG
jgi:hypothetical protein